MMIRANFQLSRKEFSCFNLRTSLKNNTLTSLKVLLRIEKELLSFPCGLLIIDCNDDLKDKVNVSIGDCEQHREEVNRALLVEAIVVIFQ